MRSLTFFLGAVLLLHTASAQDAVYADAAPDNNNKTIRLKTYNLEEIPLDKVAAIEVLPVQWDTARLGFVQTGMMNKRVEALPALPFDQYLAEYVQRQYGGKLSASGLHLLWAVKDLRINERTFQMNERGFCRIKADAFISRDGQQYAFVQAFDTVMIRNGMDVTGRHDENIARALHQLLRTTLQKGLPLLDAQPAMRSREDIKATQLAALAIPILQHEAYVDGVYASFEEFKANKPSVHTFKVEKEKRKIRIYTNDGSHSIIENAWGFCAKGELYRVIGNAIIPIEKSGHGFVVSNYLQSARRRNQAMFWSAVGGGLIGSSIAMNAAKPYMVTNIPYITRQQPEATGLDMETGELTL